MGTCIRKIDNAQIVQDYPRIVYYPLKAEKIEKN